MMVDVMPRRVVTGHCEVSCLEAGPPGGQDIVLLHGMKFKAQTWKELGTLNVLAEAGRHAVALDLPGFGASPACEASPGEFLADFLTQMQLTKPVFIGPSMGGRVALEFCLEHPELVGALVLVGAVGVQENRERLSKVTVPTLIVWGGADAVSPMANGRLLNEKIAGSSFFIIDEAPHPCYLDQPVIWHRELVSFLEKT
ncbi:MAG: alpha/beta hydrolase [Desulfobulbaceae bacterium]|nr:alpha/beta hydrolase [Pseudomonadota bacterium]MCG2746516.1 alpha/beta hydrolase [Desulfobulbaceae bacterium]